MTKKKKKKEKKTKLQKTERTWQKKKTKKKEEERTEDRADRSETEEEENGEEEKEKENEDEKEEEYDREDRSETEVEEEEDEEDQDGGKEMEAEVRENVEMISAPLRHTDDEVTVAAFLNGRREETCAEMCLRATADLRRRKTWMQVRKERVVGMGSWGGGMGWSRNGLKKLELQSGLGGNNRMGFNLNTHRPNNFINQKCDDGGVGWSTQIGSNSFQQWHANKGTNNRENGPNSFITRPNDLLHGQGLVMSVNDPRERQWSTQRETMSNGKERKGEDQSKRPSQFIGALQEVSEETWSRGFKQWDPGGSSFPLTVLFLHLEDKVNFEGGVLMGLKYEVGPN